VAEDGSLDVAGLLRLLAMPPLPAEATTLSRPQQAALDDWNDTVYLGRELAPPTERQIAAMASFGMRISETTPFRAASAALSARDYALTLTERTPDHESDLEIRMLAGALLHYDDLHNKLIAWSWHTRNQDPRRVPKDQLRAWCEMFLSRIPS
jgi:murein L,D-transpeptidase YcbB/YkuD